MMTNAIVHYFTGISYMRDWCKQHYEFKSHREIENCALAHANNVGDFKQYGAAFKDFSDMHGSQMYIKMTEDISKAIFVLGLLLWGFNVQLK